MAFPPGSVTTIESVDSVAHIIQVALTPVFMLSGIGTLLGLFNTRLARVADHLRELDEASSGDDDAERRQMLQRHRLRLHRRTLMLDASMVQGAVGGAATCGAALVLFLGGVRDAVIGSWLVILFGLALLCTVGSLATLLCDSVLAWHGLRREGPVPRQKATDAR